MAFCLKLLRLICLHYEVVRSLHHHLFLIQSQEWLKAFQWQGKVWWKENQGDFRPSIHFCLGCLSFINCSELTCLHEIYEWVTFSLLTSKKKTLVASTALHYFILKDTQRRPGLCVQKELHCYNLFPQSLPNPKIIQDSNQTAKSFPCF